MPDELPNVATIRRWVDREHWRDKLALAVAEQWPQISARQSARLVMMTDRALDTYASALAGQKVPMTTATIAANVLQLRGLGTAGAKGGEPDVKPSDDQSTPADDALSPMDRIRRLKASLDDDRASRRKRQRR